MFLIDVLLLEQILSRSTIESTYIERSVHYKDVIIDKNEFLG